MKVLDWLYSLALHAYPRNFRARFGREMRLFRRQRIDQIGCQCWRSEQTASRHKHAERSRSADSAGDVQK